MKRNIVDERNNCLNSDTLRQALLEIAPYAHRLTDADIRRLAQQKGISDESISDQVRAARESESYLLDAAITLKHAGMREAEFRKQEQGGSTVEETVSRTIEELERCYAKLGIDSEKSPNELVNKLLIDAQKWTDEVGKFDPTLSGKSVNQR